MHSLTDALQHVIEDVVGHRPVNVGELERYASLGVGAALLLSSFKSHGPLSFVLKAGTGGALLYRGLTGHCDLYQTLGVNTDQQTHAQRGRGVPAQAGVKVEKSITINRPVEAVYRFWHRLENLPQFMNHLQLVTTNGRRSHWVAKGPLGTTVEWDAEVINEHPNELIAWRSLPGGDVQNAGSVHFQPAPHGGTEVFVSMKYNPVGGKLGAAVAGLMGSDADTAIEADLQQLKRILEAGVEATHREPLRGGLA